MQKKMLCAMWILVFITGFALVGLAEMISDNYRIQHSVQSGGGSSKGSTNYQMNSTLGQPSPLMDPLDPPLSDTYDLYPGFWYVISALGSTCPGDFNGDKDVDGADVAEYIFDSGGLSLDVFTANFGKSTCP
jgi:hypothetical protein